MGAARRVLGSGLAFIDATVVKIALPHIGADLGAGAAGLQWTVNGYTLSLAALILLGGSLGDRFGRRRIYVIGLGWFAAASLLCGVAPTIHTLIAARVCRVSTRPCSPRARSRGAGRRPTREQTQRRLRLMGRARALEVMLSAEDYDAELAERYGWINRALPADELDDFARPPVGRGTCCWGSLQAIVERPGGVANAGLLHPPQ